MDNIVIQQLYAQESDHNVSCFNPAARVILLFNMEQPTSQVSVLRILQSSFFISQTKTQSPDGDFQGHPVDPYLLTSDQPYAIAVITIPIFWMRTLRFKAIMTPIPQKESNRRDRTGV